MAALDVPEYVLKVVEELIFGFLWGSKTHKIKKRVIIQDYELG